MTYRAVVNPLTLCATLLDVNFGKDSIYKIILGFILYFDK